jgi:hypothetical protein
MFSVRKTVVRGGHEYSLQSQVSSSGDNVCFETMKDEGASEAGLGNGSTGENSDSQDTFFFFQHFTNAWQGISSKNCYRRQREVVDAFSVEGTLVGVKRQPRRAGREKRRLQRWRGFY